MRQWRVATMFGLGLPALAPAVTVTLAAMLGDVARSRSGGSRGSLLYGLQVGAANHAASARLTHKMAELGRVRPD
jgi:hypothetical protein